MVGSSASNWFNARTVARPHDHQRPQDCTARANSVILRIRAIITDKLGSYAAAKAEVLPDVEHIQDKRSNNRAENSHQPTRERERRMRDFKSAGHAQRFLATFGVIATFFRPGRHLLAARNYREVMRRRFRQWGEVINPGFASQ